MKLKYFALCFIATVSLAGTVAELPVDEFRGPWLETIDQDAREYAYEVTDENTRLGPTALRFELRDGDCFTAYPANPDQGWDDCTRDRERAEVREKWSPQLDTDVWYAVSVFIPEDYEPMYPKQMFMQWHNLDWGPNIYFHLNRNKFLIDILAEEGKTTTQYDIGTDVLSLGKWHDIVVNVVWSGTDQGKMILYVDGAHVVSYSGPTLDAGTYAKGVGPTVKLGLYRSHLFRWEKPEPHPTHIIYHDEYRRGYKFEDVDINNYQGD